jgi:hypothetical protein
VKVVDNSRGEAGRESVRKTVGRSMLYSALSVETAYSRRSDQVVGGAQLFASPSVACVASEAARVFISSGTGNHQSID